MSITKGTSKSTDTAHLGGPHLLALNTVAAQDVKRRRVSTIVQNLGEGRSRRTARFPVDCASS